MNQEKINKTNISNENISVSNIQTTLNKSTKATLDDFVDLTPYKYPYTLKFLAILMISSWIVSTTYFIQYVYQDTVKINSLYKNMTQYYAKKDYVNTLLCGNEILKIAPYCKDVKILCAKSCFSFESFDTNIYANGVNYLHDISLSVSELSSIKSLLPITYKDHFESIFIKKGKH